MRSLNLQDSKSERLSNVSRVLLLALVSTSFLIFPTSGVESARASSPDPALINFNDGTCDLTTAGYSGTGSSADPYLIPDADALWELADCSVELALADQVAHFRLTNDIDVGQAVKAPTASPIGFTPPSTTKVFNGVLDGDNKVIFGISMSATSHGVGLFGTLGAATISNLVISGSFLTTTMGTKSSDAAGALARNASSGPIFLLSISNQASVTGVKFVGGLVGHANSNIVIEDSQNSGTVSGTEYVAGLVGYVSGSANVSSSYNTGSISGSDGIAGLLGYVELVANIDSSHNTGTVSGVTNGTGGLVGYAFSGGNITSSFNTGAVSGLERVGGLVGYMALYAPANINSSYNTGQVSGTDFVAGLLGMVDEAGANISSSYNTGNVSGSENVGGLIGVSYADTTVSSSSNRANVSGTNYVAGLVGLVSGSANINYSFNIGAISGSDGIAGLLGWVELSANIGSSYNTGIISASSNGAGGLVGWGFGGSTNTPSYTSNITSSYNTGAVSGADYVGGLAGYMAWIGAVNIDSSFNTGPVSGGEYVAGLVGMVDESGANISSSYNTGNVSGSEHVGGLIGISFGVVDVFSSFNKANVSGVGAVGGLVGSLRDSATLISVLLGFNIGQVMATGGVAGGLVGHVGDNNATLDSVYLAGSVIGSSNSDGLVGAISGSGTVNTNSAFTSEASMFAASSTLAEMKLASTYVGFDFTNTWGFGSCTDNQGFPMLRVFAESSNYNSVACGYAPPQSQQSTPAPAPVLQPLPAIDQTKIQTAAGDQQLLTGERFELIRSATINGMPATISQLTATSLVLTIPALAAGNYSLDLETANGRISFQGLVEVGEAFLNQAQLGSTFSVITGLNPRSSWLNKTALAELEQIFRGQSVVICISYNDRPGVINRKKALSRAMHACRIADQLGIETRVFVFGKSPELTDTVKILFR